MGSPKYPQFEKEHSFLKMYLLLTPKPNTRVLCKMKFTCVMNHTIGLFSSYTTECDCYSVFGGALDTVTRLTWSCHDFLLTCT